MCPVPPPFPAWHHHVKGQLGLQGRAPARAVWKTSKGRSRSGTPRRREMRGVLRAAAVVFAFNRTLRSAPQKNGRQETGDRILIRSTKKASEPG